MALEIRSRRRWSLHLVKVQPASVGFESFFQKLNAEYSYTEFMLTQLLLFQSAPLLLPADQNPPVCCDDWQSRCVNNKYRRALYTMAQQYLVRANASGFPC